MRRAVAVARAARAADRARPPDRRDKDARAFLPAAVEVMETPPSPAARALLWTLIAFFVIALAWSWVGRIDVVAVAEGRVVPSGRSKVVQAVETGVVRAIHVRDGTVVKQGDVLIELDPTGTGADRERLTQELLAARVAAARLRALLAAATPEDAERRFAPPAADPALVATQRALLAGEAREHAARLAQLNDERARRVAERAATQATIGRLDQAIPLMRERVEARGALAEKGYGSRLQFLEVKQQLVEAEQERNVQRHRLEEATAAIAALESQRRGVEAEFRRTKTAELNEAERRAVSLAQELVKAAQRDELQTLMAPTDGVVQQLAIHTVGGVVTPAQALLVVVPAEDAIEIEAMVLNKDIGFVRAGLPAEIKLETFTFTRYGTVPAEVVSVSSDAILDEKRGPIYAARVRPLRGTVDVDGRAVALAPGMAASVEIKTDRRRILHFLLSPVVRYAHESLRER